MGKSSAPAAPDYTAAANATAAGNLDAARLAAKANRVNTYTPYGSLTYSQNGDDPDSWSSTVNLSDTGKQLLDASDKSSLGLADLQGNATQRVADSFSQPYDTSKLVDVNSNTGMDAWDRASSLVKQRTDQSLNTQSAALDSKLANQGVTPGSEQWKIAQTQFGQQRNDADTQAQLAGLQAQNQFFNQGIAGNNAELEQQSYLRNQPLNELNALRTGSQVTNPTFSQAPQQQTTQGADLLGAANSQYNSALSASNAGNAASSGLFGGLTSLAGIGANIYGSNKTAAAIGLLSDRRLKSDIVLIGEHRGHNIYQYTIFGRREIGVMAQEVITKNPGAVRMHPSGYFMVNYGDL